MTDTTNANRSRAVLITLCVFLILGASWFGYFWFYGRFYEYTDDAYVDGNKVMITPRISGSVVSFSALDTDFVEEGRILVELDKTDACIALQRSESELADTVRQVVKLFEQKEQYANEIEVKKALYVKAAQDYEHRKEIVESGGVSLENFEHAVADLNAAFFALRSTEYAYLAILSQVDNTTVDTHPLVEKAKSLLRDAWLTLERCSIKAPVTGIVAQRSVEVGEHIEVGQALMAIVPLNELWITANFKETQLKKMRVDQTVKVRSDLYGDDALFTGKILGIGGGSGSVFTMLPPQNATGNWIKIVQRIPVRIAVDQTLLRQFPLRLGLSVEATVDVKDTYKPYIPEPQPPKPLFETPIFDDQGVGVEARIAEIILRNRAPL